MYYNKYISNTHYKLRGATTMDIYDVIQLVGGMILSVGAIPQIEQIIRTKSVKDINLTSIITLIIGMILMQIYAVNSGLTMFIITNTISLLLAITKLGLKIYYSEKE
jgi:MtN3 and saliva related transmembrane protein